MTHDASIFAIDHDLIVHFVSDIPDTPSISGGFVDLTESADRLWTGLVSWCVADTDIWRLIAVNDADDQDVAAVKAELRDLFQEPRTTTIH